MTGLYINIGTEVGDNFIFLLGIGNVRSKETMNGGKFMNNSYNWNFSFEPKIMYKITDNVLLNTSIRLDRNIKVPEKYIKYHHSNFIKTMMKRSKQGPAPYREESRRLRAFRKASAEGCF